MLYKSYYNGFFLLLSASVTVSSMSQRNLRRKFLSNMSCKNLKFYIN